MSWWYEHPEDLQKLLQPSRDLDKQLIKPFVNEKGYLEHLDKNGKMINGLPKNIRIKCGDLMQERFRIIDEYNGTHPGSICIKCGEIILASQNGKCMNIADCPDAPPFIGG
jgi:hypothetical protein